MNKLNDMNKKFLALSNQLGPVDATTVVRNIEHFEEFFRSYCSKNNISADTREKIILRLQELREGVNNLEEFQGNVASFCDALEEIRLQENSREQA